jgi:ATP-dependent RNA helicase RhlE
MKKASFDSLGLRSELLSTVKELGYTTAYPIQKQAIPAIIEGRDILGIAKTGSGKTASFVLPILNELVGRLSTNNRHINALVLVPTRELAVQVAEVFESFGSKMKHPIKTKAVYGGVSINPQIKNLMGVNILVATPGRLIEIKERKSIHFEDLDYLVLDEADKMLSMGFKDEMNTIFDMMPLTKQNLLFSATLSTDVQAVNQMILHRPLVIQVDAEETDLTLINQIAYSVDADKKGPLLRKLIQHKEMDQVLVFCSSKHQADVVVRKLTKAKINAMAIHGDKSQGARTEALKQFKNGTVKVLVATDLIARGIDIEFLPYVINYELPRSPKDYIHRIGRTGRADHPGTAISLITPDDEHHFKVIQKKMKIVVDRIEG